MRLELDKPAPPRHAVQSAEPKSDHRMPKNQSGPVALPDAETSSIPGMVRVLALAEEETITGPAKNMFEFHRVCQEQKSARAAELSMVTFQRPRGSGADGARTSPFDRRAAELGITVHPISERFRFDPGVIAQLRKLVASSPSQRDRNSSREIPFPGALVRALEGNALAGISPRIYK